MRNPERSGWQRSQVTSKICQRCVVDLSADSADRTTRPHLLALQAVIIPYWSTAWAAARQVRSTWRGAVGGTQPTEDDSWAHSALKLPTTPGSHYKNPGYPSCVGDDPQALNTDSPPQFIYSRHYSSGKQKRALPTATLTFP